MKTFLKQLLAAAVALSMVGCTTIQPLSVNASELSRTLKPGDQVEVVTASGQQLSFKVDNVDAAGVQGAGGQRVAYSDIQSISRKEMDTKRTTLVVLGVIAAGALAAAAGGGGGGGGSGY